MIVEFEKRNGKWGFIVFVEEGEDPLYEEFTFASEVEAKEAAEEWLATMGDGPP